jgi:aminoglycoside 3-N-acetyltransferase
LERKTVAVERGPTYHRPMSEHSTIDFSSPHPHTVESLTSDLLSLGVTPGTTLLVHSSLSSLGWVCGGAPAVVLALESALGPEGTLVMPAHSGDLTDPSTWSHPPVPEAWWDTIRQTMPAFDPDLTPTRGMGAIVEAFRRQPWTRRSLHPHVSFVARGPRRDDIVGSHGLDWSLGEASPLARLYDQGAQVLLLGVGYDNNTSLHLAEYRASFPGKTFVVQGGPWSEGGRRVWKTFDDLEFCSDDFETLGRDFDATGAVACHRVGRAEARLMDQRALVDFGVGWLASHRLTGPRA